MRFPWWFLWPRHDELMTDQERTVSGSRTGTEGPRLSVRRRRPGLWTWRVTAPGGRSLDASVAPTWAAALAIGGAVLDELAAGWPADADHSPRQDTPAGQARR